MATRPKAVIESRNGEKFSPITIAKNVLTDDGQNLHDILSDRKEDMMTPTIENSSSMFKVGQGDNVDYSSNVVNGAYESMVLKGKTMVNYIQESSRQDVVLPYEFEDGQYVTINDTKESGALGVELKGQTLVNVLAYIKVGGNVPLVKNGNVIEVESTTENTWRSVDIDFTHLKPNTKYIVTWDSIAFSNPNFVPTSSLISVRLKTDNTQIAGWDSSRNYIIATVPSDTSDVKLRVHASQGTAIINKTTVKGLKVLEYQEGMENWNIPYFEGMTSCKMPILHTVGKNLFNINGYSTKNQYASINGNTITVNAPTTFSNTVYTLTGFKEGELYRVSLDKTGLGEFSIRDVNATSLAYFEKEEGHVSKTFIYEKGATIRIGNRQIVNSEVSFTNIQIEHGSTETAHKSYKTSILSLPEEVVLRSLPNGVCDTFNTRTGVYTQRVGAMVLNGSDPITSRMKQADNILTTTSRCYLDYASIPSDIRMKPFPSANEVSNKLICDILPVKAVVPDMQQDDIESVGQTTAGFSIRVKGKTIAECKQRLAEQPITIQYELATPIITKINLSSTLKSWNTTTHIYSEITENTLYPTLTHSNPTYPVILKPSTKYSIVANSYSNNHTNSAINFNLGGATVSTTVSNRVTTITTPSTLSNELLTMSGRGNKLNNVMVIEGDVAGDEPYFEGICDCKSPILSNVGKNLFNMKKLINTGVASHSITGESAFTVSNTQAKNWQNVRFNIGTLTKGTYVLTFDYNVKSGSHNVALRHGSHGDAMYDMRDNRNIIRLTRDYNDCYLQFYSSGRNKETGEVVYSNVMLTKWDGDYEPYKSNTTTFNQKNGKTIVLRSLPNGVYDTLNVETGEYVQRIGEVVLDGSENWTLKDSQTKTNTMLFQINSYPQMTNELVHVLTCEFVGVSANEQWGSDIESISLNKGGNMGIRIKKTKLQSLDVTGFKQYLQANPITVQYELATPVTATIDLQGFPYAYANGHVILSSGSIEQSLTPKVEYSVVTNRSGQIRSNQKMVERHQKQLDRLQAMVLTNLVNTQYEQTLTNLKYDLKNVREEVK